MKHDEDLEQDWEPVVLTKSAVKPPVVKEEIPFYRLLINARQKSYMTQHQFAQALHIKLKILDMYEQGKVIPEKKIISRMNHILGSKLPINIPALS